nr:hypothetical protein CFP56_63621 [Quercus suber]
MHEKSKEANPITLKVFDKMPGLEAWLIKIVFDINIVQVCFGLCLSVYMLQGELLIKIVQAIRVQLNPVMCNR